MACISDSVFMNVYFFTWQIKKIVNVHNGGGDVKASVDACGRGGVKFWWHCVYVINGCPPEGKGLSSLKGKNNFFIHIASWRSKIQRCSEDRELSLNHTNLKPDSVNNNKYKGHKMFLEKLQFLPSTFYSCTL